MSRHRLEEDTPATPTVPFPVVAAAAVAIALAAGMITVDPSPADPIVEISPERVEQLLIVPPDALDLDLAIAATAAREATESAMPTPSPPRSPAPTPTLRPAPTVASTSTRSSPPVERPPAAGPAGNLLVRIVANARTYVGQDIPYVYGGKTCTAAAGCDCSALVWRVLQASGMTVGYRTSGMLEAWTTDVTRAQARPGDLVFFYSPTSHVGIYVGGGLMVDHGGPDAGAKLRSVDMGPTPRFGRLP